MTGMLDRIAEALLATLQGMSPMTVIGFFTLLLFGLFLLALLATALRRARALQGAAPALLTTLGILGTFLGVAIGLLDFDSGRVEASIPALLEGLKLAFVTSIVGILLSALLRLVQVLAPGPDAQAGSAAVDTTQRAPHAGTVDRTEWLHWMAQQRDAALATADAVRQLDQRLEARLDGQHQALLEALDAMAERLTELSSTHLVAALERVIHDFNSRLGEQFGENFRRLDASVERLVEWQERYREQMNSLQRAFEQAHSGVEQTERTLERMTGQALQITRHVEDQEATLASLRRETVELEALLGSIAALRDRASEAFPAMDARLEAMLESIENAVRAGQAVQRRHRAASAITAEETV
ncbi:hypothetical protein [Thioalkalivibrio sp. ALJT]|uniref:hypothetical protein n=1 Tax=Thioalkalivibrio sp. ALJT TaxID=1158146 RepID=UPI00038060EE|nr:hypothetical protein [Thioalkalivibrio sp. ALJT]